MYSISFIIHFVATKESIVITGKPTEDPSMFGIISNVYQSNHCSQESFFYNTTIVAKVDEKNGVEKDFDVSVITIYSVSSAQFLNQLTCETPLEPMVPYKVEDSKCVDSAGEDPWKNAKALIGTILPLNMTFTESTVLIKTDLDSRLYKRLSDEGCEGPTVPPTVPPTPAPSNHLWMWLWISAGIIIIFVVIIVICQNCKKPKQNCVEKKPLI